MGTTALIVPAAGSGSRLNQDTPKPYIVLAGKPILEHTLRRFLFQKELSQIIVATSAEYVKAARDILNIVPEEIDVAVIEGGEERQHSIFNALQVTRSVDLVMIHDAVRPFVTPEQIKTCCSVAEEAGAAVLGIPARDTVKRIDQNRFIRETPPRKYLWQTQTPQVFKKEILMKAYQKAFGDQFVGTDDSSLVERLGVDVKMVEGDRSNFKITYPLDLKIAKILLEEEQQ